MTFDEAIKEAIKHEEKVVSEYERLKEVRALDEFEVYCLEYHRQLAEWMQDYKRLLEQEPCDDCISREETLKALMDEWTDFDSELMDYLIEKVKKLPSVTPQPKMGTWVRMSDLSEDVDDRYKCSKCGNVVHSTNRINLYTFHRWCGRCGSNNDVAKMQEVGK